MRMLAYVGIVLLLPATVFAAGFAKQSLFLSQANVTEGDTVFIYAVVTNDTVNYFSGNLVFSDEHGPIGTSTVELDSDRANAYSVSWKPAAGSHTITARLLNLQGKTVESEDSVFVVDKPALLPPASEPAPKSTAPQPDIPPATVESSQPLTDYLSKISPKVGSTVAPAFTAVDTVRGNAVDHLNQGTQWSKDQIQRSIASPTGFQTTLWLMVSTVALYVCTALAYVLANIGIFYPVLVALFFFILWRLYRLIR